MAKADGNKVFSRPIIIKHFCKLPLIFKLLMAIGLLFISIMTYFGMTEKNGNVITIVALLLVFFFTGFGFYFNYGVKITSKRVYILYQNAFRIFNLDDIVCMEISFDNDSIYGRIKAKDQKPYYFCFDDFVLGSRISGFEKFWTVKVSLSDKYINQKKKELLKCNKIRVK